MDTSLVLCSLIFAPSFDKDEMVDEFGVTGGLFKHFEDFGTAEYGGDWRPA
ncbi:hypothetical protein V6Z11_D08G238800 [Gossypium hirsutum]